jgi:hypothetical protein
VSEVTALKIDFVYATKKSWLNETFSETGYSLLGAKESCGQKKQQECCSVDAMNFITEEEKKAIKKSCKDAGCNKCSTGKRRTRRRLEHQINRELKLIEGNLTGTELLDAIKKYTDLDAVSTGAILDATNLTSIAICTASRHNYTEYYGGYYIKCEDYDNAQCEINDYLMVQANRENFCREPPSPTASPRPSSSTYPTYKWTPFPAWAPYPTWKPTSSRQPTQSPYPTPNPTLSTSPTITSSPTLPIEAATTVDMKLMTLRGNGVVPYLCRIECRIKQGICHRHF